MSADNSKLPTKAPERWRGVRAGRETVVDFFRRVWSPYLRHGLTSEVLMRLDRRLIISIRSYTDKTEWPADLAFPNRWSRTRHALQLVEQGRWSELHDREIIAALRRREREAIKAGKSVPVRPAERRWRPSLTLRMMDQGRYAELTDREIIQALRKRLRDAKKSRRT